MGLSSKYIKETPTIRHSSGRTFTVKVTKAWVKVKRKKKD